MPVYSHLLINIYFCEEKLGNHSELFPWAKSSMWVVEWVKNNFCGGNKLRVSGFTTILKPVLPIILNGNTI